MSLPSKLRALWHYRPRILTLLLLFAVAAPIAMANFTSEIHQLPGRPSLGAVYARGTYGWPFMWHWHNLMATPALDVIAGWNYSGARLVANLACWSILLAAPAVACEWLLRQYRPRLRWSLRTMLAGMALAALGCAWFAAARDRAYLQDSIITELVHDPQCIAVERPGPTWLEFVVPDRFRRRIVAIDTRMYGAGTVDEAFVVRLGRLPRLTYLNLEVDHLTPAMAAVVRNARQLRWLYIDEEQPSRESLAALGELTQLEGIFLYARDLATDSLPCLDRLTNLKTLSVEFSHTEGAFSEIPALPNLEVVDIIFSPVSGPDLRGLADLPRLKALDLKYADFGADAKLGDLATSSSLEELTINGDIVSAAGLESLAMLKHLRALHLSERNPYFFKSSDVQATLKLDGDNELIVFEREMDGFRRALHSLRQSHSGIVIDGDVYAIDRRFEREPPWDSVRHGYQPGPPWDGIEPSILLPSWLPARLMWAPLRTFRGSGAKASGPPS